MTLRPLPQALLLIVGGGFNAAALAGPPADTQSYDVGLMMGSQIVHDGLGQQISIEELIRGLKDAIGGRVMAPAERDAAQQFMHDAREALAERNRTAGKAFLEDNGRKPDVVTLPSGLQYRILAAGSPQGPSPAPTDEVTVRYRTLLTDGTEVDNSEAHGRAASFRVNSVFKGWQEALARMKPGARWQLFVPPELGYGRNSPATIPPGALLIYELELLQVSSH